MPRSTGFPTADAADDFQRARRRQVVARLARRLRGAPGGVSSTLSFTEVVARLGALGARHVGLRAIPLGAVVGSVDRPQDFDQHFRPTSGRSRERWQRIAAAQRRGEPLPPISVYQVGALYFVRDGHHRVSVARSLGSRTIEADVTTVRTRLPAAGLAVPGRRERDDPVVDRLRAARRRRSAR